MLSVWDGGGGECKIDPRKIELKDKKPALEM